MFILFLFDLLFISKVFVIFIFKIIFKLTDLP